MHLDRFGNNIADGHSGRKRRIRILENQLNIRTVLAHFAAFYVGDVITLEENFTAVRFVKFEYRSAQSGFAATGLAHYADSRAGLDGKTDVIHRFEVNERFAEQRLFNREVFLKVVNFENILRIGL